MNRHKGVRDAKVNPHFHCMIYIAIISKNFGNFERQGEKPDLSFDFLSEESSCKRKKRNCCKLLAPLPKCSQRRPMFLNKILIKKSLQRVQKKFFFDKISFNLNAQNLMNKTYNYNEIQKVRSTSNEMRYPKYLNYNKNILDYKILPHKLLPIILRLDKNFEDTIAQNNDLKNIEKYCKTTVSNQENKIFHSITIDKILKSIKFKKLKQNFSRISKI